MINEIPAMITVPAADPASCIARRLRSAYFRNYNWLAGQVSPGSIRNPERRYAALDGGRGAFNRYAKSVWGDIAAMLQQRHVLDPEGYIAAQFVSALPTTRSQLLGDAAWSRYKEWLQERERRRNCAIDVELSSLQVEVDRYLASVGGDLRQARNAVLLGVRYRLSPVFRYVIAHHDGYNEVTQMWQSLAVDDYLRDPKGYDLLWGNLLPESLKQQAETHLGRD
jgi:hypothetical protein